MTCMCVRTHLRTGVHTRAQACTLVHKCANLCAFVHSGAHLSTCAHQCAWVCVCVCTTSTTAPGLPYWDRDREDKHYGDNELTLMTNKLDDNTTNSVTEASHLSQSSKRNAVTYIEQWLISIGHEGCGSQPGPSADSLVPHTVL